MVDSAYAAIADIASAHGVRDEPAGQPKVLIGLIGRGISASRSPIMHEREGARLSMRFTYGLIDFDVIDLPDEALGAVLDRAEGEGFAGVNVTHPFKQAVIPHLSDLSSEAAAVSAVNTVVFRDGRRTGHNTDCWAFAQSFREQMTGCSLERVLLYGAGGGGAAVGHALLDLGAQHVFIFDINADRARHLADRLSLRFDRPVVAILDGPRALAESDGIVNATPVGMKKYPGTPLDAALLRPGQWVADIVYFPAATELLMHARAIGCRTFTGTGMAILQAARAFELFTGVAPDRGAMARHFEAAA